MTLGIRDTSFGNTAATSIAPRYGASSLLTLRFTLATKAFLAMRCTVLLISWKSECLKGDWRSVCISESLDHCCRENV